MKHFNRDKRTVKPDHLIFYEKRANHGLKEKSTS
jgi:hypothetical protein